MHGLNEVNTSINREMNNHKIIDGCQVKRSKSSSNWIAADN